MRSDQYINLNEALQAHPKTADIIHCQDCKWYKYGKHFTETKFCSRLKDKDGNQVYYNFSPDDFCSRGVRRNENDPPDDELLDHCESLA